MKRYRLILSIALILASGFQCAALDIPVRVFDGSGPVPGLSASQFSLAINHKSIPISGLTFHQKQLKDGEDSPPRVIILEFHISHFSDRVKDGLAFVMADVLKEDDRLIVVSSDFSFNFEPVGNKTRTLSVIHRILEDQEVWTRGRINTELKEIGKFADKIRKEAKRDADPNFTLGRGTGVHPHYYMKYFKFSIEKYLDMLMDYKRNIFLPNIYRYHDLAEQMEHISGDKWLISFYEVPMIPRFTGRNRQMIVEWIKLLSQREWLDELDYTRKLERLQGNIDDVFDVSKDAEDSTDTIFNEMIRLFYKSGITYHSVFIGPPDQKPGQFSIYPKNDVAAAMADRLAQTARYTGGSFIDAADLKTGLDNLLLHQAPYYLLSCTPPPETINAISIKTAEHHYRTFYDDRIRSRLFDDILKEKESLPPQVRLENVSFKDKRLAMSITGFLFDSRNKDKKKDMGKLNVHIVILDQENKVVFDQEKGFDASEKMLSVALGFKKLGRGDYNIAIRVKDVLTGKTAAHFFKVSLTE